VRGMAPNAECKETRYTGSYGTRTFPHPRTRFAETASEGRPTPPLSLRAGTRYRLDSTLTWGTLVHWFRWTGGMGVRRLSQDALALRGQLGCTTTREVALPSSHGRFA
jgi:hypothetical protein